MHEENILNIAVGMSAKTVRWKNQKFTWDQFVNRIRKPHYTNETYKQYRNAPKSDRDKIKDVGGYVGAFLRKGRRKPANVVSRSLITLDMDFANMGVWEDIILTLDYAAILHATHSHHKTNPRFRLILPLDKEVTADQYVAIARRIAGDIGIDYFDTTTFQPFRLMYWQSSPKDVKYYFREQKGEPVDTEAVLDSYIDWKDSSEWPTASSEFDKVDNFAKKQQDPQEKRGIVGAFCKTYGIVEAIEKFLPNAYLPTTDPNRWTYAKGSTAGGLILYDGKFAFSHHGTDPASSKLCNSFDLVRLHKFGVHDEGSTQTNIVKRESYKFMEEFARDDDDVRKLIALQNYESAVYDFAEPLTEEGEEENDAAIKWMVDLEIDRRGGYTATAANIDLILKNDVHLRNLFTFNCFDSRRYVAKVPPWRKLTETPETVVNADYSGLRNYLERIYGITAASKIDDSLALEFRRNTYHPIKDYLEGLEWDGEPRVDQILIKYFGASDNLYTREAVRKTLVAAVARLYNAGAKFDLVLTLSGKEGTGKSTLAAKLGGKWFSDSFQTVQGKESFEQLRGSWIIEMAELSGLRKAEVEAVKHFISKRIDTYRPAYGREIEDFKRQCVFIATTNEHNFLQSQNGNRRFMPIDVRGQYIQKSVFTLTQSEVNQIWAEAVEMFHDGEKLYLSAEAEKIAKREQSGHTLTDSRKGLIFDYLERDLPAKWDKMDLLDRRDYLEQRKDDEKGSPREEVCVAEIWVECLGKDRQNMDRYKTRPINEIMENMEGWERHKNTKTFPIYGKQRYYSRSIF